MSAPKIAILTDFGDYDPFVGIMRGVMSRIAPQAKHISITQQIPPGDIQRAAVVLWQSVPHFPPGTIFLVVVDPGVGTERRAIIFKSGKKVFIGPDNGVFSYILDQKTKVWELSNPDFQYTELSSTFHGRDIFSPAAAYASLGIQPSQFGDPVQDQVKLPTPDLDFDGNSLRGEVLTADHFGNLLTSLGKFSPIKEGTFHFDPWIGALSPRDMVLNNPQITLADGTTLPLISTFGDLTGRECGVLVGSTGLLELVANQHAAAEILKLNPGDPVTFEP